MCDVLVEHEAIKNLAVLDLTTGNLLDTSVALDVDFGLAVAGLPGDGADSLEGESAHLVHPAGDELCADRRGDELGHGLLVVDIDGQGDLLDDFKGILEGALEGGDDDDGVYVAVELGKSLGKNLTG
jgi:hypothetical protein